MEHFGKNAKKVFADFELDALLLEMFFNVLSHTGCRDEQESHLLMPIVLTGERNGTEFVISCR